MRRQATPPPTSALSDPGTAPLIVETAGLPDGQSASLRLGAGRRDEVVLMARGGQSASLEQAPALDFVVGRDWAESADPRWHVADVTNLSRGAVRRVRVALVPSYQLELLVVESATGRAIEGLDVEVQVSAASGLLMGEEHGFEQLVADGAIAISFATDQPGRLDLELRSQTHEHLSLRFDLAGVVTPGHNFLSVIELIRNDQMTRVQGTVVHADGTPAAGAVVGAVSTPGQGLQRLRLLHPRTKDFAHGICESDGSFDLVVPTDRFSLIAAAEQGREAVLEDLAKGQEGLAGLQIVLPDPIQLSGYVFGLSRYSNFTDLRVQAGQVDGVVSAESELATVDPDTGEFRLETVPSGRVWITIEGKVVGQQRAHLVLHREFLDVSGDGESVAITMPRAAERATAGSFRLPDGVNTELVRVSAMDRERAYPLTVDYLTPGESSFAVSIPDGVDRGRIDLELAFGGDLGGQPCVGIARVPLTAFEVDPEFAFVGPAIDLDLLEATGAAPGSALLARFHRHGCQPTHGGTLVRVDPSQRLTAFLAVPQEGSFELALPGRRPVWALDLAQ